MKKILLSIVLLIGILLSCGFQTTQELDRKSGGYTESELVASGRVGTEGSDGTLFFSGFYKAPNGNYIPLNDNVLMGQTIQPTMNPTNAESKKESVLETPEIMQEVIITESGKGQEYIDELTAERFNKLDSLKDYCANWKTPCTVPIEYFKEGTLLKWLKIKGPKFSDEVYDNGKVAVYKKSLVFIGGSDLKTKDEWNKMWSDLDRKPIKLVGSYQFNEDPNYGLWEKLIVDVFAVYNSSDNTTSFLFYFLGPDFNHHVNEKRAMSCRDMAYTMPVMVEVASASGYIPKRGENILMDAMYYEPEENKKLLKEWAKTNKVPAELEGRLLIALTNKGDPDYSNREWSPQELLIKPW